MKEYMVIEDNGGGLTLVVFAQDGETIEYIHSGYEYTHQGHLLEDLEALKNGDDPARNWDGNELESEAADYIDCPKELCGWFPFEQRGVGWEIVADNDGIYPSKMGAAAMEEFGIDYEG